MAILKSLFVSLYVTFLLVAATFTLFTFLNNDDSVYWFSSALSTVIPAAYFIYIYIKRPAEVSLVKMLILPMVGAAMLISLGRLYFEGEELALPARLAMISFFGWILYDMWFARLPKSSISTSNTSEWSFQDPNDKDFKPCDESARFRMYVFIRGSWCPFCMAQLRDLGNEYKKLEDLEVQVNFITHKTDRFLVKAAEKTQAKVNLLSDKNLRVATQMGLSHENSTPLGLQLFGYKSSEIRPAVVIADDRGNILETHLPKDYRKRPEPAWFLRLIEKHAN